MRSFQDYHMASHFRHWQRGRNSFTVHTAPQHCRTVVVKSSSSTVAVCDLSFDRHFSSIRYAIGSIIPFTFIHPLISATISPKQLINWFPIFAWGSLSCCFLANMGRILFPLFCTAEVSAEVSSRALCYHVRFLRFHHHPLTFQILDSIKHPSGGLH